MTKISLNNFIIPYFIIKSICRDLGAYPMDVSIEILDQAKAETSPVAFVFSSGLSRKQLNLSILNKYLGSFESIHGFAVPVEAYQGALSSCAAMCDMYYDNSAYNIPSAETGPENFPFNFIACKNIIYPYLNINDNSCKILCDSSGMFDFSLTSSGASIGLKNLKIEFRDAFIMMCIDSHYKKENNANFGIIYQSLNSPDIMRMLFAFAVPYFNDDANKADAFMGILQMYADCITSRPWFEGRFSPIKTAQKANMDGNFWIYGIIEKMLAPARGPDFTITNKWAPITNEVWENIDSARRKAGLSGASLSFMLQVKDHRGSDDSKSIQALIEEMRQ